MELPVLSNSFSWCTTGEITTTNVCGNLERPGQIIFVEAKSQRFFCLLYFSSGLVIHLYAVLRRRKLREVTPPGMRRKKEEQNIKDGGGSGASQRKRTSPRDLISGWPTCFLWSGTRSSHNIREKYHVGKIVCKEYRVEETERQKATTIGRCRKSQN